MKRRLIFLGSIIILTFFLLVSCGPRYQGYGVILWTNDETPENYFSNAQVVGILTISEIRNVYGLKILDNDDIIPVEMDRWRVQFFDRLPDANEFAERYQNYQDDFARSLTQGLPIRVSPDNLSAMAYRLRQNEQIKILSRQETTTDLSGLVDYWYQALTSDGTKGWVFGYNLQLESPNTDMTSLEEEITDELLLSFLENPWRPESYAPMIRDRQFNLDTFSSRFGLFPDSQSKTIKLVLPGESREFNYTSIFNPRYGQYIAEGSDLQFTMTSASRVVIQYESDGRIVSRNLILVQENIDELLSTEVQRRRTQLNSLVDIAANLQSATYGTLSFSPEGTFRWTNYQAVQSNVLPQNFSGAGRIVFDRYVGRGLSTQNYSGILSFIPNPGENWNRVTWLYTITEDGIRFEHISQQSISNMTAVSRDLSPFIIFFRYAQTEDTSATSSSQ